MNESIQQTKSIKQRLEDHAAVIMAMALLLGFSAGWSGHIAVQKESNVDNIQKGTYVLIDELDAKGYVKKDKCLPFSGDCIKPPPLPRQTTTQNNAFRSQTYIGATEFTRHEDIVSCQRKALTLANKYGFYVRESIGGEVMATDGNNALAILCEKQWVMAAGPNNDTISHLKNMIKGELLAK